jgi:hypothetical protein
LQAEWKRVKGVAMKRMALLLGVVAGLLVSTSTSHASWGAVCYSGYQPWWNIFAKRYKCLTPEEERLQKFWHDYYDALKNFYCDLDHIDWVAYYKNHGYAINSGCGGGGCGRINYAPVFVTPSLQWAVPCGAANGPPVPPGYGTSPMVMPTQMGYGHGPGPVAYGPPPGAMQMGMPAHAGPIPGMFPGSSAPVGIPVAGPMGGAPMMAPPGAGAPPMMPPPMNGGR